jgi:two-component system sensor histidine kinase VicK
VFVKQTRADVLEIISFVLQELKKSYPDRRFLFDSPPGPVYIDTDEVKLLQVVNNLASNAVKFTLPEKLISFIVTRREDAVAIEVRDEGIGIPDTLRPYIFDRFSKAGRIGLHGERSFGLGLSICRRLVTLMGGLLWADSEEGKGSSFYLLLPFKD